MDRFDGKVAIVTGGGNGIGAAIVERLAREGASVVIVDREEDAAQKIAQKTAGTALGGDVSDPETALNAVKTAVSKYGKLNIVICNAGITDRSPFLEMTPDFFERVIGINLKGSFYFSQAAAKQMVAQGEGGRIITVASNSGLFGGRGRAAYGASKAGLINLVQTMAIELAEYGINVNAVVPGPTKTRVTKTADLPPSVQSRMPLQRFGKPEEIASVAAFLASDEASFVTGQAYAADGGYTTAGMMEG
jgi:3-oxoacyl-[acyl-carrier protein] reductase